MRFDVAPLDSYATRVTTGLAYLGGLLMLPLLFAYLANLRWGGLLIPSAFALPLALFLLLTYVAQARSYEISDDKLLVRRRLWRTLAIPLKDVNGASLATQLANVPRSGLRFAFNPGIFGYLGPFQLAPYGSVFFLATNRERLVAISRRGAVPLLISPEKPREFIEKLNEQRTQAALANLGNKE